MIAIIINALILILEVITFVDTFPREKWGLLAYYTELSNLCAAFAAAAFLLLGRGSGAAMALRYLATCMLALTFLVVVTVLIPLGARFREMFWDHHGFLYHFFAPALSLVSYVAFEEHAGHTPLWLPLGVTIIYGGIMLALNAAGRYEGPYPFFKVKKQSVKATVIWVCIILGAVTLISWLLQLLG